MFCFGDVFLETFEGVLNFLNSSPKRGSHDSLLTIVHRPNETSKFHELPMTPFPWEKVWENLYRNRPFLADIFVNGKMSLR